MVITHSILNLHQAETLAVACPKKGNTAAASTRKPRN